MTEASFLIQLAATLMLTGLIWTIQCVHYPLFERVGREGFAAYHKAHGMRITWLVSPLMILEAACAAVWIIDRPEGVGAITAWAGAGLVAVLWISTAGMQIPLHRTLAGGFDPDAHRALVRGNWIRTGAWTARSLMLILAARDLMMAGVDRSGGLG